MKRTDHPAHVQPVPRRGKHRTLATAAMAALLLATAPSLHAGASYPQRDDETGAHLQVGVTAQHWVGPASAFAAFGDRAGYAVQVSVPLTRATRLVAVGVLLPADWRLGDLPTCSQDGYDGQGDPSLEQVASAAACAPPQVSQRIGVGAGWQFRVGPGIRATHAVTVDAAWLRDLVVPMDLETPGGTGLAPVLAVGPDFQARFAWRLPVAPLEIGLSLGVGLFAADVGDAIQVYAPLEVGLDVGIATGWRVRPGQR